MAVREGGIAVVQFGVRCETTVKERGGPPSPDAVLVCGVDAGGIPGEWVEVTVATPGQATFLHFSSGRSGVEALMAGRELACEVAIATGARVFSVGCRRAGVQDGVTAYAWLLGEGLDLHTSCFIMDPAGNGLARAVAMAARACGLPIPPPEI